MKRRNGKRLHITAAAVLLGILVTGWAVISYAAEDEYKVHHNITIDLDGGTCESIYYQSQIDNGEDAGKWNDDLRTGEYLPDYFGEYHTINDYKASVPEADATTSNYYDCVGVTPYVRIGAVSREGYILKGWEVTGDRKKHDDYGEKGIRVNIGAFTDEDIVIRAIWQRQTFTVSYSAGVAADRGIAAYLPADEDAYYGHGNELSGFAEGASADNGLIFTGWSFDRYGDSGILKPEDMQDYNEDVTVYAVWDYIITFDNNTDAEVTGYMEDITTRLGGRIRLKGSSLSRKGYYLSGWNTESDDSGRFYTTMSVVDLTPDESGRAVLYAIWQPIFYEVHLYNNKPEESSEMMKVIDNSDWDWYEDEGFYSRFYTYDKEDELPLVSQVYALTGWTGCSWETEDGIIVMGGEPDKLNLSDKMGAVVDLTAVWKENIYNINIDSNGGYEAGSTIITGYEKENELPDSPHRPGYDFDSWNTDEDGKGERYEDKDVVSKLVEQDGGNMTIYAQWKKKKKLCLKVSSNSYLKAMINPAAQFLSKNWFNRNDNTAIENMMNKPDKDCVQVWSVSRNEVLRTR